MQDQGFRTQNIGSRKMKNVLGEGSPWSRGAGQIKIIERLAEDYPTTCCSGKWIWVDLLHSSRNPTPR